MIFNFKNIKAYNYKKAQTETSVIEDAEPTHEIAYDKDFYINMLNNATSHYAVSSIYSEMPKELREDTDILQLAIYKSPPLYFTLNISDNRLYDVAKQSALEMIENNEGNKLKGVYRYFSYDDEILLATIKKGNMECFSYASHSQRSDSNFIKKCIEASDNLANLIYIYNIGECKEDEDVVYESQKKAEELILSGKCPLAFTDVLTILPEELETLRICKQFMKREPGCYPKIKSDDIRDDLEIYVMAKNYYMSFIDRKHSLSQNPQMHGMNSVVKDIPKKLLSDKGIAKKCVECFPNDFVDLPYVARKQPEVYSAAIKQQPELFSIVLADTPNNFELLHNSLGKSYTIDNFILQQKKEFFYLYDKKKKIEDKLKHMNIDGIESAEYEEIKRKFNKEFAYTMEPHDSNRYDFILTPDQIAEQFNTIQINENTLRKETLQNIANESNRFMKKYMKDNRLTMNGSTFEEFIGLFDNANNADDILNSKDEKTDKILYNLMRNVNYQLNMYGRVFYGVRKTLSFMNCKKANEWLYKKFLQDPLNMNYHQLLSRFSTGKLTDVYDDAEKNDFWNFVIGHFTESEENMDMLLEARKNYYLYCKENNLQIDRNILNSPKMLLEESKKRFLQNANISEMAEEKSLKSGIDINIINGFIGQLYSDLKIEDTNTYSDFLKRLKISDKQNIKPTKLQIGDYLFEITEKTNPENVTLSRVNGCCQDIRGAASDAVYDGLSNPNSAFLAVYDKKHKLVAISWLRLGKNNILYLDNIEASGECRGDVLTEPFTDFCKQIKEMYGYKNVLVGKAYLKVEFPGKESIDINTTYLRKNISNSRIYTDLDDGAYVVANKRSNWYKFAYSKQNSDLDYYFKDRFNLDNYDDSAIEEYLIENGILQEGFDYDELQNWKDNASQNDKENFISWVSSSDYVTNRTFLEYKKHIKPQWLIHFTNHVDSIVENGFQKGFPKIDEDFSGIASTRWVKNSPRLFNGDTSGYNYAFTLNDDLNEKYGNDAVVFWGDGVKIYHPGDDEKQVIFWGENINKNMIYPIYSEMGEWVVRGKNGRKLYASRYVEEAAAWIVQNHRMIDDIKNKQQVQQKSNNWYKKAYSNENSYLRDYLKSGFNPYDYMYELSKYLKDELDIINEEDPDDFDHVVAEQWLGTASPEDLKLFQEWLPDHLNYYDSMLPSYEILEYQEYLKPTWLVHFTNNANNIEWEGFQYGHEDLEGLAITDTKHKKRKTKGYNFAFEVGTSDARLAGDNEKYGNEAIIFYGDGVKAYHSGDEEYQIIFWGDHINKNLMYPVYKDDGYWKVYHPNTSDRILIMDEDFNKVASWIIKNHHMIDNVREKNNRINKMNKYKKAFNYKNIKQYNYKITRNK